VTADPVSWLLIERNWAVVSSDGQEVGRVEAVVGDEGADIFDGLTIATRLLGKPRYVPAEQVTSIVEGEVQLALSAAETEHLPPYDGPP
jgi:hypothetical protein